MQLSFPTPEELETARLETVRNVCEDALQIVRSKLLDSKNLEVDITGDMLVKEGDPPISEFAFDLVVKSISEAGWHITVDFENKTFNVQKQN